MKNITTMELKDIIRKDNKVEFEFFRGTNLYYSVSVKEQKYIFPVPINDVGDATFLKEDKSILFMRYIRKALENETFTKTN